MRNIFYVLLIMFTEPHDPKWRDMMRNDNYRRNAKY